MLVTALRTCLRRCARPPHPLGTVTANARLASPLHVRVLSALHAMSAPTGPVPTIKSLGALALSEALPGRSRRTRPLAQTLLHDPACELWMLAQYLPKPLAGRPVQAALLYSSLRRALRDCPPLCLEPAAPHTVLIRRCLSAHPLPWWVHPAAHRPVMLAKTPHATPRSRTPLVPAGTPLASDLPAQPLANRLLNSLSNRFLNSFANRLANRFASHLGLIGLESIHADRRALGLRNTGQSQRTEQRAHNHRASFRQCPSIFNRVFPQARFVPPGSGGERANLGKIATECRLRLDKAIVDRLVFGYQGSRAMAQGSSIEWTEATWNPVAGCTPSSPTSGRTAGPQDSS